MLLMLSFLAEEAAYTSFYTPAQYPVSKLLREEVFVQVNLVERSDPNIILNLEHCWATSTPSPHSFPQWELLMNGYLVLTAWSCNVLPLGSSFSLAPGVPTVMTIT